MTASAASQHTSADNRKVSKVTTDNDYNGTLTFRQLQTENDEWATRNFPDTMNNPAYNGHRPLLGVDEEVGELAKAFSESVALNNVLVALGVLNHAQLKGEQAIRHTPEEIAEMKNDAVGDGARVPRQLLHTFGYRHADSHRGVLDAGAAAGLASRPDQRRRKGRSERLISAPRLPQPPRTPLFFSGAGFLRFPG